jgi:hypothetical protein
MPTNTWPTRLGAKIASRKNAFVRSFFALSSSASPRLSGSWRQIEQSVKKAVFFSAVWKSGSRTTKEKLLIPTSARCDGPFVW